MAKKRKVEHAYAFEEFVFGERLNMVNVEKLWQNLSMLQLFPTSSGQDQGDAFTRALQTTADAAAEMKTAMYGVPALEFCKQLQPKTPHDESFRRKVNRMVTRNGSPGLEYVWGGIDVTSRRTMYLTMAGVAKLFRYADLRGVCVCVCGHNRWT